MQTRTRMNHVKKVRQMGEIYSYTPIHNNNERSILALVRLDNGSIVSVQFPGDCNFAIGERIAFEIERSATPTQNEVQFAALMSA